MDDGLIETILTQLAYPRFRLERDTDFDRMNDLFYNLRIKAVVYHNKRFGRFRRTRRFR